MKNVLIVSYSYPPSNAPAAQRPYALAKYLDKTKYQVTVLTCSNADSSLGFDMDFDESLPDVNLVKINAWIGSKASSLRQKSINTIKPGIVSKVKEKVFSLLSNLVFPDKAIFWYPNVKKFLRKNPGIIREYDIVITTSPVFTNHLVGRLLKRRNKQVQWIADFRDFHAVGNEIGSGFIKSRLHRWLEHSVIKRAGTLVFVSGAMRKEYENHYPLYARKMQVVYNGVDISDFDHYKMSPVESEKLSIFYAGSFYKGVRSPHPLFELLDTAFTENILQPSEVEVKIAGRIDMDLIANLKHYNSYPCMKLLGLLPRQEVLEQLTNSTLLWSIVGNKLGHYSSVPLKLFEYIAARRPVINFAPDISEASQIIDENSLGWNFDTITPNKQDQIIIFKEIINKFKEGKLNAPLSGEALNLFNREKQATYFEQIFDQ